MLAGRKLPAEGEVEVTVNVQPVPEPPEPETLLAAMSVVAVTADSCTSTPRTLPAETVF